MEGGLGLPDTCRIAPHLEAAGVDLLDVSSGIYEFDIGDCVVPRTAFEAMQEGAALGHRL